jgi:cholinesterase
MLIGNNDNEAGLFQVLANVDAPGGTTTSTNGTRGGGGSFSRRTMNLEFTCPAGYAATARRSVGVPAWRYRYGGEWPNQQIGPRAGAWHGSEIAMVFGTAEYISRKPDIADEKVLGDKIRLAWTSFAKDPEHGLEKLSWPLYNASRELLSLV